MFNRYKTKPVSDGEYIIPIASTSEVSDNIYDTIQEPAPEIMYEGDICLPDQCKQRSFFVGTMCRDMDLQNASKYDDSTSSLFASNTSACSTYSVVSNTNKFLYLYRLLKGLMHEYADILLEQSDIHLKSTQLAEEETYQSIKSCSNPSVNDVSINGDITKESDNLPTDLTENKLSDDVTDKALGDTLTPAEAGQPPVADMEDLITVQNMIHDELKKAWECLSKRIDNKLTTELETSGQQSLRRKGKEVEKENTASDRLSELNFEYKDGNEESPYVLGRIPVNKKKDLDIENPVASLNNEEEITPTFHDV